MKHNIMTALLLAAALEGNTLLGADDWKAKTISPVANPIFFEDPQINSEIRPLFAYHWLDDGFPSKGGDVQVYAVQLRYAVNDRLAIIATKDGYIDFNPDQALKHETGWADIAAGLKYAVIDDKENQFIVTPGITFEIPMGNRDVFQGNGNGEWNVFVSAAKGFGDFHLTGNVGGRIPNNFDRETAQLHYSLQADYYTCQYFIPFLVANAFTVLSETQKGPGLTTEGYDLINFGSSKAGGRTSVVVGAGFRSRVRESVDIGFAYEIGVTNPKGIFDRRVTADVIWRF